MFRDSKINRIRIPILHKLIYRLNVIPMKWLFFSDLEKKTAKIHIGIQRVPRTEGIPNKLTKV